MTEKSLQQTARQRQVLDEEAAALDADTARALRLARDKALNERDKGFAGWPVWLGSAAASVVLLGLLLPLRDQGPPGDIGVAAESVMADLEVLAQEDDLGLIEDLEFLDWLSGVDEENT